MSALSRFLRGFGLPLILLVLARFYRILQRRKRLADAYPGLILGPDMLLGNASALERDSQSFLQRLFPLSGNQKWIAFLVRGRPQFASSDPGAIRDIIANSAPVGPVSLVESQVTTDDLKPCESSAHDIAVHVALKEIKNWHRGLVALPETTDELVITVVLQLFFGNRAIEFASVIRASCTAKMEGTQTGASVLKEFLGLESRSSRSPSGCSRLERIVSDVLAAERDKDRRLPNRLRENLSIIDVALEKGYTPATVVALLLDTLQLCSSLTSWLVYSLARHEEEQGAIVKEVDNMVGRRVPPKANETHRLKLLNAFIRETARLFSPIASRQRVMQKDVHLGDDCIAPVGSTCYVMIGLANRASSTFTNPNILDLERSLAETQQILDSMSPAEQICINIAKAIAIVAIQKFNVKLKKDLEHVSMEHAADFGRLGMSFECQFELRTTRPTL